MTPSPEGWVMVPREPREEMLRAPDEAGIGLYSRDVFAQIYRAMLSSVPASPPTSEVPSAWRPIATAPRDGTRFIGYGPQPTIRDPDCEARETYWQFYAEGSQAKAWFDRGEGPSGDWCWVEPVHNWASSWKPTHWMPLPPAPVSDSGSGR